MSPSREDSRPDSPRIAKFRPEDIPDVLELWRRAGPGVGLSRSDEPAKLTMFLGRNPGTSFVARSDGRVIGAVLGGWDGRRGYIHHLAVAPDHRRRGLGKTLTGPALDALRRAGADKVHIFVHTDNAEAIEFYRRSGWYWRDELGMMSFDL